jgi:SAM-dependent methyltransferase
MSDWDAKTQLEIAHQAKCASKMHQISPTPQHILERYTRSKYWWAFPKEFVFKSLEGVTQKEVLDFGCGTGEISNELALLGAHVTGIDISPELVEIARRRVAINGVQDRAQFIACDVTKSPLPENKFDWVLCYAVLHHVDLHTVMPPLVASLKPGGRMVAVEPVAFSPTLQRIRSIVPIKKDSSPIDRQLNAEECDFISGCLDNPQVSYYDLFNRLTCLFPWKAAYILFGAFDRALIVAFPFLARFYGEIVIVGSKPTGG